jgi:hypothetical protein
MTDLEKSALDLIEKADQIMDRIIAAGQTPESIARAAREITPLPDDETVQAALELLSEAREHPDASTGGRIVTGLLAAVIEAARDMTPVFH